MTKQEASNKEKEETPNKEKKDEVHVEELINSLSPSYFQVITKVYKDGKEEKRYIWAANFRMQSLGGTQRIIISKPPSLY